MWLKKHLKQTVDRSEAFDDEISRKFGSEVDVCLGTDYEARGKVNSDIAIFKWDYTFFMSPEELKKMKDKPEKLVAPKSFDFTKAERVIITKEDLK